MLFSFAVSSSSLQFHHSSVHNNPSFWSTPVGAILVICMMLPVNIFILLTQVRKKSPLPQYSRDLVDSFVFVCLMRYILSAEMRHF